MIKKVNVKYMTKQEWLNERSKSIGGSEMGSILGMNPWQSAYALWCERTGRTRPFEGNLATEVGTALEPFVADKFAEISGLGHRVMKSNFLYRNDKCPHMHASPDRLIYAARSTNAAIQAGLECKTTSAWNTQSFKGIEFPMQYYAQCVAYMTVLEVGTWYVAVLVGNHDFHIYKLVRQGVAPFVAGNDFDRPGIEDWVEGVITVDDDDVSALKEAADAFWHNLEEDVAPPPDGKDSSTEAIKTQYPRDNGAEIWLDGHQGDVNELILLKAEAKEIDEKIKAIENIFKYEMGEAEKAHVGTNLITWKTSNRTSVDTKKLKAEMPDIYTMYSRTSETRTFSIK